MSEKHHIFNENTNKEPSSFTATIDEKKALLGWQQEVDEKHKYKKQELYNEPITEEYSFHITRSYSLRNDMSIRFSIEPTSGPDLAVLNFKESGAPNIFNMEHRLVETKGKVNITGSEILEKSENYFKILQANDVFGSDVMIFAECDQTSVVDWLLKNGYIFRDPEQHKLYDDIVSGKNDQYKIEDQEYKKTLIKGESPVRFILEKELSN